jgi:hypothetical protein
MAGGVLLVSPNRERRRVPRERMSCLRSNRLGSMRPGEGEFEDLRLAAKAADRGTAAEQQWPAFEKRLRGLGYSPLAIAHAFSTLSGPGSVDEALEVLRAPMPESHPIALTFQVTETRGGPSAANRVTITSVERDSSVIHVNYDIVGPPDRGSHRARGEAKDDLGNDYRDLGGYFGLTGSIDSTDRANRCAHGRVKMPLPPPGATMLRIRITWDASQMIRMPWDASPPSIWNTPAHEVRVSLPD